MVTNRRFKQRHRLYWAWLALTLAVLAACSLINRGPVLGDEVEFQPQTQVTIDCNTTCSDHGQCGTAVAGNQFVLGGQAGPTVANHDRIFPGGMAATIQASSVQTIETVQSGNQSQLYFYHIQPQDGRQAGWVAGWCLAVQ
jgi:hypothetical protein